MAFTDGIVVIIVVSNDVIVVAIAFVVPIISVDVTATFNAQVAIFVAFVVAVIFFGAFVGGISLNYVVFWRLGLVI